MNNEFYESNHEYVRKDLKRAYRDYADSHPSISKMMQLDQVFAKIDEVFDKTTLANEVLAIVDEEDNDVYDVEGLVWEAAERYRERKEAD